jgi:hypothetical protein
LLWGLINSNKFHSGEHLWTIQSESLYLPAFISEYASRVGFGFGDAMVGKDRPFLQIRDIEHKV